MNDFHTMPLKLKWNELLFKFIKRYNKKVIRGCWGDDAVVFEGQARGELAYSDTHIGTRPINVEENKWRMEEQHLPEFVSCFRYVNKHVDAFVACLYEYFVYYDRNEYRSRLHYLPLPIEIPSESEIRVKGTQWPIKVLVGIQTRRDYIKGAGIIATLVEKIAVEHPDKVEVRKVYDVPYVEYCKMLAESDVLVDQLYSYTPSMNSLAAMARGTVVIGGGEEEYYDFIGERELRPIINVRPEQDEENLRVLREALLTPGRISQLSRDSVAFVRKHHDYMKVSKEYLEMYESLVNERK
ncbi:MAG: glycosyltransferase [Prevotella sp.]